MHLSEIGHLGLGFGLLVSMDPNSYFKTLLVEQYLTQEMIDKIISHDKVMCNSCVMGATPMYFTLGTLTTPLPDPLFMQEPRKQCRSIFIEGQRGSRGVNRGRAGTVHDRMPCHENF
jgi:hypothetical protein